MANKLMVFLGLAEDGVVIEKNRKRRNDYMKKIQGLVMEDSPARAETDTAEEPEKRYTIAADSIAPVDKAPAAPAPAEAAEEKEDAAKDERTAKHSAVSDRSIAGKFLKIGSAKKEPRFVLVRKDVPSMIDDIEEALSDGRTVLVDFESEDPKTAKQAVSRIVNFVRVHNGAFYAVTKTSLLVTMDKGSVVEWLPESDGADEGK